LSRFPGLRISRLVPGWRHRGAGDRIDYTVHGDAVNLAARLEQRCAIWRHRMLVE
jgi:class 3 adenylate cyclase